MDFGVYGRFVLAAAAKTRRIFSKIQEAAKLAPRSLHALLFASVALVIRLDLDQAQGRARLRYVYIVDDDVSFPVSAAGQ